MKRVLPDKKCRACGVLFRPRNSLSVYCSYECNYKNIPKRSGSFVTCTNCHTRFWKTKTRIIFGRKDYCSRRCSHIGLVKSENRKCLNCNKEYAVAPSQERWRGKSKYCSLRCRIDYKHKNFMTRKRSKKTRNATLKKTLWTYFSQYVRQRDDGVCISCGKKEYWRRMDAGHYVPKTAGLSLYFDERNVNCQCTRCNRWMHGNLSSYALALRERYGNTILEDLEKERIRFRKYSDSEYIDLIERYKALIYDRTH